MTQFISLAVVLVVLVLPGVARAYTHSWGFSVGSAETLSDGTGANPNPWVLVDANTAEPHSEICAKARTPSGSVRTGSRCLQNTNYVRSSIAGATPESQAYVYWAGPFGPFYIAGFAAT